MHNGYSYPDPSQDLFQKMGMPDNLPKEFNFQRRFGKLDWRKLSAVDVDRLMREVRLRAHETSATVQYD